MRFIFLLCLLASLSANAITNGIPSQISSVVDVFWSNEIGENFHCSGVLITPRHVLTAEHCVPAEIYNSPRLEASSSRVWTASTPNNFWVYFGPGVPLEASTSDKPLPFKLPLVRVLQVDYHPQSKSKSLEKDPQARFNKSYVDLAILTLDQPISDVLPAELPTERLSAHSGNRKRLLAVGFGSQADRSGDFGSPNAFPGQNIYGQKMEYAPKSIILNLKKFFGGYLFDVNSEPGQSVQPGDSGGPLFEVLGEKLVVIGIVHFEYTSVFESLKWIKSVIGPTH